MPRRREVKELFGFDFRLKLAKEDFIFGKKLGEGAYSQVFMAMERKTGLLCSVKVLEKEKIRTLKVQ